MGLEDLQGAWLRDGPLGSEALASFSEHSAALAQVGVPMPSDNEMAQLLFERAGLSLTPELASQAPMTREDVAELMMLQKGFSRAIEAVFTEKGL